MDFDGCKASGVGASLTWVVGDEVSTSCYSSSIEIVFFRSVGAHGASSIGDSATGGNLVLSMKKIVLVPLTVRERSS